MHDVVVVALGSPIRVGIYEDGTLIDSVTSDAMSSEALPQLFETLLQRYEIAHLVYANGPGSFMAIKVTYLFLKTLSIVRNIPLLAADAFCFNDNAPIKAVGKLYFVKLAGAITTQKFETPQTTTFRLPSTIDLNDFSEEALPNYAIGAVG